MGQLNRLSGVTVVAAGQHNTDTGETMQVDSPDWISVSGRLASGAEVTFLTTTVPHHPSGQQFEIYGRDGTLVIKGDSPNTGSGQVHGARGDEPLASGGIAVFTKRMPSRIASMQQSGPNPRLQCV